MYRFCFRIEDLIGYSCEELIDKSLYNYHHALDNEIVEKAYKDCELHKHLVCPHLSGNSYSFKMFKRFWTLFKNLNELICDTFIYLVCPHLSGNSSSFKKFKRFWILFNILNELICDTFIYLLCPHLSGNSSSFKKFKRFWMLLTKINELIWYFYLLNSSLHCVF